MFALPRNEAKLKLVQPRNEKHGEDKIVAVSLHLQFTGPNTILDLLSPTLREALYMRSADQEDLPGVEPSTPRLRTHDLGSLAPTCKAVEGGTFYVEHGIGEEIALGLATAAKWRVDAMEGGTVHLHFRINSSDIGHDDIATLVGKMGQVVHCRFVPPEPASEDTIDGTQAAFDADHPDADQATILDAMEHGTDAANEQPKRGRGKRKAA